MTTTIEKYHGGLIVRATIPDSKKNNTRRSQRTWRIKCLRPELAVVEMNKHIRAEVDRWVAQKQKYFAEVTGKPSTIIEPNIPGI